MVNAAIFRFISEEKLMTTARRMRSPLQIRKDGAQLQNISAESGDSANKNYNIGEKKSFKTLLTYSNKISN